MLVPEGHDFAVEIAEFLDQHRSDLLNTSGRANLVKECLRRFPGVDAEQINRACEIFLEIYNADVETGLTT
jgi:hypothetical protein